VKQWIFRRRMTLEIALLLKFMTRGTGMWSETTIAQRYLTHPELISPLQLLTPAS
jgi:hypothetical protein